MNSLMSFVIVSLSVVLGFAWANGPFSVLFQPHELIIILGTALGALIGYAPLHMFGKILKSIPRAFRGSGVTKNTYLDLMGLLLTVFNTIRREGVLGIEDDLADPAHSERFKKYPLIAKNPEAMDLLVGSLRLFIDGVVNAFDLDKLMETEIEAREKESSHVPLLLGRCADALPGLGIVGAVLGIIITMQHVDGPPSVFGHNIAAALVGTFLGILLSYGYVQPIASSIEMINHESQVLLHAIRAAVVSFAGGAPPTVALEFARKSIEGNMRPTADEIEAITQAVRRG